MGYFDSLWLYAPYYSQRLLAEYVADDTPSRTLSGENVYAGQTITIAGGDGADNQIFPDVIQSLAPQITANAFDYVPGQSGGQTIDRCQPYRAAYFAFGFEAINDRSSRAEVLSRTLAQFDRVPLQQVYAIDAGSDRSSGRRGRS